ncbi:hypothetical protein MRET_1993 [Malassezia restricta]|uniref:uncharacterized protein n=1 Tax=Malassezia restricta TaxID=76775 RepID=UPI000DD10E06|nr:uncharacterized protein MRET_1993 [Malassezia restricta]AXA49790.1 hypothetical protein MRET_1993 [Malassezia restricta]
MLVYTLVALVLCAQAFARTSILLNTRKIGASDPVQITPPDAHRVLSHHLNMRVNVLPDVPMARSGHANLWHHAPAEQVHYDASVLFEPVAPSGGNVIITMYGPDDLHALPDTLTHTHTMESSSLRDSFEALASLYEKTANGAHKAWDAVQHSATSSLERLQAELAHIARLGNDIQALSTARIHSLADVGREYGTHSQTYRDAQRQVKQTLELLVQRVKNMAGAGVAVVYTTDASNHERRADPMAPTSDPLHVFRPPQPVHAAVQSPGMQSSVPVCPATREELERTTQQCHGRGTPVQSTKGGRLCWRCACSRTTEQGRGRVWAGAACEKQDYSSETLLFIGTFLVLFVSIVASCALLYREGTHELPGTLSSVSLRS